MLLACSGCIESKAFLVCNPFISQKDSVNKGPSSIKIIGILMVVDVQDEHHSEFRSRLYLSRRNRNEQTQVLYWGNFPVIFVIQNTGRTPSY
jgi:hypothetical protein